MALCFGLLKPRCEEITNQEGKTKILYTELDEIWGHVPMSYIMKGKQYFAIRRGNCNLFTIGLPW